MKIKQPVTVISRQEEKGVHKRLSRAQADPGQVSRVQFSMDLPIHARLEDIRKALDESQVVVVCGATGSGKTTQLPKLCLDMQRGREQLIGHTQPRRIAAKTVAMRVAEELGTTVGQLVGYQVRHSDQTTAATRVKLMTDGILLMELQQDRQLARYDTLIVDEAHERSLNIDFILGYLKRLLPRRPDLKLIITSATIDVDRFAAHFGAAPIIEISGRGYPVEVRYRPLETACVDEIGDEVEDETFLAVHAAIRELAREGLGDILVFLEGEREIHALARFLARRKIPDSDVLPLYSRLSSTRQALIFKPHRRRHIVLATNVAETSLTIPGIHYVIDTGLARISRYNRRGKVQQLPIEKISRAAADQRAGRCGRTAPGVCIRLYDEEDYLSRSPFPEPEILRTNLASVILQVKALRLGTLHDFPFIDAPELRYVNDGVRLLQELGALDHDEELTRIGRRLACLPLDPGLGRALLAAGELGCVREILIIVSGLSIQDPRERPLDAQAAADAAHERFIDERSDFLTLLNLWVSYDRQARTLGTGALHRWCRENFLSAARMREWRDVHRQLQETAGDLGLYPQHEPAAYQNVHVALITGLPGHIAMRTDEREYTGARGIELQIFPGSGQFRKLPKWIICAELVETTRLFARQVASIEPQWVLRPVAHLLHREYHGPYWDPAAGQVYAYERIKLFGLTLVERQRVNYARVQPADARRIFIRSALVERNFRTRAGFFVHNNRLVDALQQMEHKARRNDIYNEDALYDFYERIIPAEVGNGPVFTRWLAGAGEAVLMLEDAGKLMYYDAEQITPQRFPDKLEIAGRSMPLSYRFAPGAEDDGITIDVPLPLLNQIKSEQVDYLVPGMLEEKILLLLKNLPKAFRRYLTPVAAVARECAVRLDGTADININLSLIVAELRGVHIPAATWNQERLPDYLRMQICVVDDSGTVLAAGRDLRKLQRDLAGRVRDCYRDSPAQDLPRQGLQRWDFDSLPENLMVRVRDTCVTAWPALVDRGHAVFIEMHDTPEQAAAAMRYGLRRLFMLELKKDFSALRKCPPQFKDLPLPQALPAAAEELEDDLMQLVAHQVFLADGIDIRTREAFVRRRDAGQKVLFAEARRWRILAWEILKRYHELQARLASMRASVPESAVKEFRQHLETLVRRHFLVVTDAALLQHYPRYLDACGRRLERLSYAPEKDAGLCAQLKPFLDAAQRFKKDPGKRPEACKELEEFHWFLEEFRVSLFAQELGTAVKVSAARLRQRLERLQREFHATDAG